MKNENKENKKYQQENFKLKKIIEDLQYKIKNYKSINKTLQNKINSQNSSNESNDSTNESDTDKYYMKYNKIKKFSNNKIN